MNNRRQFIRASAATAVLHGSAAFICPGLAN